MTITRTKKRGYAHASLELHTTEEIHHIRNADTLDIYGLYNEEYPDNFVSTLTCASDFTIKSMIDIKLQVFVAIMTEQDVSLLIVNPPTIPTLDTKRSFNTPKWLKTKQIAS